MLSRGGQALVVYRLLLIPPLLHGDDGAEKAQLRRRAMRRRSERGPIGRMRLGHGAQGEFGYTVRLPFGCVMVMLVVSALRVTWCDGVVWLMLI
jgi:hypothetical protein